MKASGNTAINCGSVLNAIIKTGVTGVFIGPPAYSVADCVVIRKTYIDLSKA